jgi:GLPGLI family protein
MKILKIIFLSFALSIIMASTSIAQKKISEFMIVYDYTISNANTSKTNTISGTTNTIYIKGNMTRSEIASQSFSSTIIQDATTGSAVILKEVSGQKILIRLNPQDWQQMNKSNEGIIFSNTDEKKTIAGYQCTKAVAKTQDGSAYTVYYTTEVVPANKEYNPKFKNLDGLPLEYELTKGNLTIKYTVAKINLNPVPASKFDIPKSGYREMTYEESKKLNFGG